MSRHREFSEVALTELLGALRARSSRPDDPGLVAAWPAVREDRKAAACAELGAPGTAGSPCVESEREARQDPPRLGGQRRDGGAGVPSLIIVAESETDVPAALGLNRRTFQLNERVTSSDVSDPMHGTPAGPPGPRGRGASPSRAGGA